MGTGSLSSLNIPRLTAHPRHEVHLVPVFEEGGRPARIDDLRGAVLPLALVLGLGHHSLLLSDSVVARLATTDPSSGTSFSPQLPSARARITIDAGRQSARCSSPEGWR